MGKALIIASVLNNINLVVRKIFEQANPLLLRLYIVYKEEWFPYTVT